MSASYRCSQRLLPQISQMTVLIWLHDYQYITSSNLAHCCLQAAAGTFSLKFASPEQAGSLRQLVSGGQQQPTQQPAAGDAAASDAALSEFSRKTDESSAEVYFRYYGMLQHQQVELTACLFDGIILSV